MKKDKRSDVLADAFMAELSEDVAALEEGEELPIEETAVFEEPTAKVHTDTQPTHGAVVEGPIRSGPLPIVPLNTSLVVDMLESGRYKIVPLSRLTVVKISDELHVLVPTLWTENESFLPSLAKCSPPPDRKELEALSIHVPYLKGSLRYWITLKLAYAPVTMNEIVAWADLSKWRREGEADLRFRRRLLGKLTDIRKQFTIIKEGNTYQLEVAAAECNSTSTT